MLFRSLIAPRVFPAYWELPLALAACGVLALAALWNVVPEEKGSWALGLGAIWIVLLAPGAFRELWALSLRTIGYSALGACVVWTVLCRLVPMRFPTWSVCIGIALGTSMLSGYMIRQERESTKNLVLQSRNFYGPLEVRDDPVTQDYAERTLLHGTINHGSQLRDQIG